MSAENAERLHALLQGRLEPELMQEMAACAQALHFSEGEVIMLPGQFISIMPLVLQGTIKVSRIEEEGRELLLYYLLAGETCAMTFTCCMMQQQSEIKATAEDEVELLAIPIAKMDEWLGRFPTWKHFVMQSVKMRFHELLQTVEKIAFQKLDQRLIEFLREKERASGSAVIHMTHQQIADDLGTSRVVISRLLKQLENEHKLILYRHEIKLLRAL